MKHSQKVSHDIGMQGMSARLAGFASGACGGATPFALFTLIFGTLMAGIAVDQANGWRQHNRVQIAADAVALAAAAQLPDLDAARRIGLEVARRNLNDLASAIGEDDIHFGRLLDDGSFVLTAAGEEPKAVRVQGDLNTAKGNPISTYFLHMVGVPVLETGATSIALTGTTPGNGAALGCEDAMILTDANMDTGGGNDLRGNICLHGRTGLHTGGGDYYAGGVQLSAERANLVTVNYTVPGSATADEVRRASDLRPVILPKLQAMFDELWTELSVPGANGKDLRVDGYYTGDLLPDFLKDSQGRIAIVHVDNGWWTAQPGELKPYTVYLVNHGMQIAGNVQAQNTGIIARGQIGIGGGPGLHYTNDFLFALDTINAGGDIKWGDEGRYCETGQYSAYTFAVKGMVSLGGWGGGGGAHGLFGAAPRFNPGGAMRNSGGLYFEAGQSTQLGGNLKFQACGVRLDSHYPQAMPVESAVRTVGARLTR